MAARTAGIRVTTPRQLQGCAQRIVLVCPLRARPSQRFQIYLPPRYMNTGGEFREDEAFLQLTAQRIQSLRDTCHAEGPSSRRPSPHASWSVQARPLLVPYS